MDYFLIYLWTRLDAISNFAIVLTGIFLVIYISGLVIYLSYEHEDFKKFFMLLRRKSFYLTAIISFFLALLIPSKKDFLYIYLLPKTIESQFVIDTVDLIETLPQYIKDYLNESKQ